ncbi:MAG: GTPase HflX [Phycisphaeraceae bacterium]|nr:GTPase HflX [Phycisphaeraceae bacterium]
MSQRQDIEVKAERTVVAAVRLPESRYDPANPFGELVALAQQAGAVVVGELEQFRDSPEPGTFIGSGKLEELRDLCERLDASVVIFDHELSPRQIGNIEKVVGLKVLDRSELILDIFASRATTRQARLQVELAQLEYTYPRLRAMWTHLERIAGGGGMRGVGTRGPGEQQLEIDRRLVQRRKLTLQRELADIQARKAREVGARRGQHVTVGLVGYTNAGKSTLFNALTAGGAYADDRVFATLMTRTREWRIDRGVRVMLSDTVGFVRDLPHHLVASFRATLEEATHADVLLIVLDVSDPAAELHFDTVQRTLDELFKDLGRREPGSPRAPRRILLLNKIDRLRDNREVLIWRARVPDAIPISSLLGPDGVAPGLDALAAAIRDEVVGEEREIRLAVPMSDGRSVLAVESAGQVLERRYEDDSVVLTARLGMRQIEQLRAGGVRFVVR